MENEPNLISGLVHRLSLSPISPAGVHGAIQGGLDWEHDTGVHGAAVDAARRGGARPRVAAEATYRCHRRRVAADPRRRAAADPRRRRAAADLPRTSSGGGGALEAELPRRRADEVVVLSRKPSGSPIRPRRRQGSWPLRRAPHRRLCTRSPSHTRAAAGAWGGAGAPNRRPRRCSGGCSDVVVRWRRRLLVLWLVELRRRTNNSGGPAPASPLSPS
jgi:hypothetical protein